MWFFDRKRGILIVIFKKFTIIYNNVENEIYTENSQVDTK